MTKDTEIPPEVRAWANEIATIIESALPEGALFPLIITLLARAEGEGRMNYISNADRAYMACLLREVAARLEGQPEMSGTVGRLRAILLLARILG